MLRMDDVVRALTGYSVIEAIYSDRVGAATTFDRTMLTHPAIFMVEYSLARSLMHAGVTPDFTLGCSLGSFAAAAVASFIEVDAALTIVVRQAGAFEACCERGGMIAVLGDPALYAERFLCEKSELAAINYSSHFVVAATQSRLEEIEVGLKRRNLIFQRLPVSFAFHSRWIESAKAYFETSIQDIRYANGKLPMICCERAVALHELPLNYFWDVVRRPIRFREAMTHMEPGCRFIDVGPGGTLATLLKYGSPTSTTSTVHAVLTPFGRDLQNFAALVEDLG
jgi:acyl transferase domain-containing protein